MHDHHERVTVTVHGRLSAVLVAVEDLERLEETLAILRDAGTMDRLADSDAELGRGEPVSAAELAETMRRRISSRSRHQNEQQAEQQRHRTASDADRKAEGGLPVADGGPTGPNSLTSLEHAS